MLEKLNTGLSMTIFLFTFNGKRIIKTRTHDYILDKLLNNLVFHKTIFFIINITTYMTKDILLYICTGHDDLCIKITFCTGHNSIHCVQKHAER